MAVEVGTVVTWWEGVLMRGAHRKHYGMPVMSFLILVVISGLSNIITYNLHTFL